jgi:hypothetical protein
MGATAAIAMTAIGTGVSASGQVRAGNAANRTAQVNAAQIEEISELNARLIEEGAEENAGILQFNARMLEAMGRDAIRRGFEEEERFALGVRQLKGSQRAGYAAQGIDVDEGSPLDVYADTEYTASQDLMTIRVNAAREAWGFQVDAEDARMQERALRKLSTLEAENTRRVGRADAVSTRLGGQSAQAAGRAGAASTILGSAGTLLAQRYGYGRATKGKEN